MSSKIKQRFYDPSLDIVRFIACALVLFHHIVSLSIADIDISIHQNYLLQQVIKNLALWGGFGVIYFYTLSAFLLTKLFFLEYESTGSVLLGKFWVRRCLRIWPLYFFYIGLLLVLSLINLPINVFPSGWRKGALFIFLYNWVNWHPDTPSSLTTILWSVCLEEQFYVLLIIIIALFGLPRLFLAGWVLIAVGIASRIVVLYLNLPYPAI
jgi:peptidoglycan/LPS O-acetylase OafA/YrhL